MIRIIMELSGITRDDDRKIDLKVYVERGDLDLLLGGSEQGYLQYDHKHDHDGNNNDSDDEKRDTTKIANTAPYHQGKDRIVDKLVWF